MRVMPADARRQAHVATPDDQSLVAGLVVVVIATEISMSTRTAIRSLLLVPFLPGCANSRQIQESTPWQTIPM
jgi:hypothetical protein